jgi:hypothetical protein
MNEIWYSKQSDNAPMPHAVFFTKEGHAIGIVNGHARHGCASIAAQMWPGDETGSTVAVMSALHIFAFRALPSRDPPGTRFDRCTRRPKVVLSELAN